MSYIIIATARLAVTDTSINKDDICYVYDTSDGTLDKCTGDDIFLLVNKGRHFLNYAWYQWISLGDCCIANPKLGIALYDYKLYIAYQGILTEFLNVEVITWIALCDDMLVIGVVDTDYNTGVVEIDKSGFVIKDDSGWCIIGGKVCGRYKEGLAGVEVMKRCI